MRSDAYKLLRLYRRPDALPAEDVGMWAHVQDAMGYLGVLSNVGILCFTTMLLTDYSDIHKWLIFLVSAAQHGWGGTHMKEGSMEKS